jgi:hypothetical protein
MSQEIFKSFNKQGPLQCVVLHKNEQAITIYENRAFYKNYPNLLVKNPVYGNDENPLLITFLGYLSNLVAKGKMLKFEYGAIESKHSKLHEYTKTVIKDHDYHIHLYFKGSINEAFQQLQQAISEFQSNTGLRGQLIEEYYLKKLKLPKDKIPTRLLNIKLFDKDLVNAMNAYTAKQEANSKSHVTAEDMAAEQEQHLMNLGRNLLSIENANNDPIRLSNQLALVPSINTGLNQQALITSMFVPGLIAAVCFVLIVYKLYQAVSPTLAKISANGTEIFNKVKGEHFNNDNRSIIPETGLPNRILRF